MSDCGCHAEVTSVEAGRTLRLALALNAGMFVVEMIGGVIGESSGLIADSLDMLADASAYAIAIAAVSRGSLFKARAATVSGAILLLLGLGACVAVIARAITGSEPESLIMAALAIPALVVNTIVLRLLSKHRNGEVHLRATWIFTRADVVANVAVLVAAMLVFVTGSRYPDLVVGFGIGLYVTREALEILKDAAQERAASR
ncbi:MAG TPA: cation transporter [Hyphomonas sp.]|nr:cation transporter [Hyphomonas sp.]